MGAVLLWTRSLWRRHWRATVLVGLAVGLAGGAATSAWEYSRRAGSAVDRWVEVVQPADSNPEGCPLDAGPDATPGECFDADEADVLYDALERSGRLDGIETTAALPVTLTANEHTASSTMFTVARSRGEIDLPFVVSGRQAAPDAVDEVTVTSSVAAALDIGVGDVIGIEVCDWQFVEDAGPCTSFHDVRVVGLEENSDSLHGSRTAAPGSTSRIAGRSVRATGAAWQQWAVGHTVFAETALNIGPAADADQVTDELQAALPDQIVRIRASDQSTSLPGLTRTVDLEASALRILAVVMAVISVVFSLQVLTRQMRREMHDRDIVRSLGGGRSIAVAAAALRNVPTAAVALLAAGTTTVVASMFGPRGIAGRLETDRGARTDVTVIAVGALAIGFGVVAVSAVGAFVARRTRAVRRSSPWARRPASVSTVVRAGSSLAGSGRRQFVWPAAAAVAVAVLMVGVASSLSGNLDRTRTTPAAFGASWDYGLTSTGTGGLTSDDDAQAAMDEVLADPTVASAAFVVSTIPHRIDGTSLFSLFAFIGVKGSIEPVIVDGRAPVADDEVAFGPRTLDELGLRIGDEVAGIPRQEGGSFAAGDLVGPWEIVGVALLSNDNERVGPGRGALVTDEGMQRLVDDYDDATLVVTTDGSVAPEAAVHHWATTFGPFITVPSPQADVTVLAPLAGIPWMIAVFLAVLAAVVVFHALISCLLLGRRQLAVLRALGFRSSQVRLSVMALAGLVTVPAAVVGLGLAVLSGRWAWALVRDQVGLGPDDGVAAATISLGVLVVLGLAAIVAVGPAWRAARGDVAEGLRSE